VGNTQKALVSSGGGYGLQAGYPTMVKRFSEETTVRKRHHTKLVHEGDYVAEVDVEFIYTDEGWSPYLSLDDAQKLDDVREALRKGDIRTATEHARVYTLAPVAL